MIKTSLYLACPLTKTRKLLHKAKHKPLFGTERLGQNVMHAGMGIWDPKPQMQKQPARPKNATISVDNTDVVSLDGYAAYTANR